MKKMQTSCRANLIHVQYNNAGWEVNYFSIEVGAGVDVDVGNKLLLGYPKAFKAKTGQSKINTVHWLSCR